MKSFFDDERLNQLVFDLYNYLDNFKVVEVDDSDTVYIFFSSHGLYYPDTYEEVHKSIVEKDRYDWENISKSINYGKDQVQKIFVRDIYKNWCLNGISAKYSTQEEVYELLKSFSKKNVITVGSSAGGYMAILYGYLLNAKKIFCFSPQINLHIYYKYHPYKKYEEYIKDVEKSKYLDLVPIIENYKGEMFYFYPNQCQEDIAQYEVIKGIDGVNVFSMNRNKHGSTIFPQNMIDVLSMNDQSLQKLCRAYHGKNINLLCFSIRTSGLFKTIKIFFKKLLKR